MSDAVEDADGGMAVLGVNMKEAGDRLKSALEDIKKGWMLPEISEQTLLSEATVQQLKDASGEVAKLNAEIEALRKEATKSPSSAEWSAFFKRIAGWIDWIAEKWQGFKKWLAPNPEYEPPDYEKEAEDKRQKEIKELIEKKTKEAADARNRLQELVKDADISTSISEIYAQIKHLSKHEQEVMARELINAESQKIGLKAFENALKEIDKLNEARIKKGIAIITDKEKFETAYNQKDAAEKLLS